MITNKVKDDLLWVGFIVFMGILASFFFVFVIVPDGMPKDVEMASLFQKVNWQLLLIIVLWSFVASLPIIGDILRKPNKHDIDYEKERALMDVAEAQDQGRAGIKEEVSK